MTDEPAASGSTGPGTPTAEVEVTERLVRDLLGEQCPHLAGHALRRVASGWDNATYRLGDDLAVRLPRRTVSAPLIEHEQRWLPVLAQRLALPIPVPVAVGRPGSGFPWSWSVVPWFHGTTADRERPASTETAALAAFFNALHRVAPDDAPANPVRGVPLEVREASVDERMHRLRALGELPSGVEGVWQRALEAPVATETCWLHGDLHPRNVLVRASRLSAVIDWGDVAGGDPATDVAATWMLFPEASARRQVLVATHRARGAFVLRAMGWAVLFGVVLLDTGLADDPRHATIGRNTLLRVAEDAST